ncbi:17892_t:CDS:2, partial [Acaulospora morrowiae]
QGWHESVRRIVINEKDSELLQDTKELLKGTLGRFIKAFSLDAPNPLKDVTMLERPHLNQFIHPLIDNALWIFASENCIVFAVPVEWRKGSFNTDVVKWQALYCIITKVMADGARLGARNDKNVNDDKKNIKSMIQLFNYIIVTVASERRQVYTGLRVYGVTACKTELSLTMLDFHVDRFCLPKDWVDMPNFVFMYEALIKWA